MYHHTGKKRSHPFTFLPTMFANIRAIRLLLLILCGTNVSCFIPVSTFRRPRSLEVISSSQSYPLYSYYSSNDDADDDDNEEDDEFDLSNQDWRDFRAKLVMQEPEQQQDVAQEDGDLDGIGSVLSSPSSSFTAMTPLDPSQWAYESGNVIEKGAVILGGVEQEYGFGLRQQYFHKAAILVLDHEESTFTKGIILNRPSDLTLDDDWNEGVKWRVWFGGDVQGLNSNMPEIVCLHSLKDNAAIEASVPVMKDIQVSRGGVFLREYFLSAYCLTTSLRHGK
jgi:putative AlgH/UPF0301 family transcriptional regulator